MTTHCFLTVNGERFVIEDFSIEVENELHERHDGVAITKEPTGNVFVEIEGEDVTGEVYGDYE